MRETMSNAPHTWPRLFVVDKFIHEKDVVLNPDQSHYLCSVMRCAQGDSLRIFNGSDGEWRAMVSALPKNKKDGVTIRPINKLREQTEEPDLTLACSIIKRAHFEFMIMKATELGVRSIQPVLTSRTQIRDINIERLQNIAVEASEQSERLSVPRVQPPMSLEALLKTWERDRLLILCAEFGEAKPVAEAFSSALAKTKTCAGVLTGPEGGFTEEEMALIRRQPNILPIRLGPRILRADTAALSALACWQSQCGDWQTICSQEKEQR